MSTVPVQHQTVYGAENGLNLLVSGFGLQKKLTVSEVVAAVKALPVHHYHKIKVIKYDPKRNISFLLRHQRMVPQLGEYLTEYDSIVIYEFDSKPLGKHVIYHEIGHHVYFRVISPKMKKKWVTEIYKSEDPVTNIGRRNAAEDFAEAYALYHSQQSSLKKTPNKYDFIAQLN